MYVTATELKNDLSLYLELASQEDIFITKNGKNIAKLTSPQINKLTLLNELVGIIPNSGMDAKTIKEERLTNKYNENII